MYEINYLSRPHLIYPSIENIFSSVSFIFAIFVIANLLYYISYRYIEITIKCFLSLQIVILLLIQKLIFLFNKNFARKFYWLDSTFILSSYLPTNDSLYHDQTIKLCNRWTSLLSWNRKLSLVKCNEIRFLDIHHDFCTSWNINKIKRCFLIFCLNNPLVHKTR